MPYNLREKFNLLNPVRNFRELKELLFSKVKLLSFKISNGVKNIMTTTPIFLVWIILVLIVGGLISVFSFREFIRKPEVGVIRISGPILYQEQADEILEQVRYAKDKKTIKAVVLKIDSPGGEASVIEEIYLALLKLREEKPIVASINQKGASGGYYIAVASNFIYAKPDSEIGSIGAWTSLPRPEVPSEYILPSGPFKDTGMTSRKAVSQLEMLKQSFLGVVLFHRGEKLKLSPEELIRAEVYTGIEGLRAGLIDEIGTSFEAIEKAAKYAGISHYQVVDIKKKMVEEEKTNQPTLESSLEKDIDLSPTSQEAQKSTKDLSRTLEYPDARDLLPTFYYLIESR